MNPVAKEASPGERSLKKDLYSYGSSLLQISSSVSSSLVLISSRHGRFEIVFALDSSYAVRKAIKARRFSDLGFRLFRAHFMRCRRAAINRGRARHDL